MKTLYEYWKRFTELTEAGLGDIEQSGDANSKTAILQNSSKEADTIITKIKSASKGDVGLEKESLELVIKLLQTYFKQLPG